jgi:protein-disulfide isomerase
MRHAAFIGLFSLLAATAAAQALPGVNLEGLDKEDVGGLETLLSEGACPCDPKLTLRACIQQKVCPAATVLANYGAQKYREGLGPDEVGEAVIRKYINDYIRYEFDLTKAARKGATKPKIVIVEFADFECPHCALVSPMLTDLVKMYQNDVAVYFKNFPLPHHTFAHGAARAAIAAGRQNRFWQMHDLLFANQGRFSEARFVELAEKLALDVERFKRDMADPAVGAQVDRERSEGLEVNISGTPSLYINGKPYLEEKTPEKLKAVISQALEEVK